MKKVVSLLLAAVILASAVTSCGDGTPKETKSPETKAAETNILATEPSETNSPETDAPAPAYATDKITENGAATHITTGSHCLDLFATIGALRSSNEQEIVNRFVRAYTEDPDLAMKTLFFARDVRGGLGERKAFRICLNWLAHNAPASARKNIPYVAEFGRWDDLLSLMGTPCEGDALMCIKKQLETDLKTRVQGEIIWKNAVLNSRRKMPGNVREALEELEKETGAKFNDFNAAQKYYKNLDRTTKGKILKKKIECIEKIW